MPQHVDIVTTESAPLDVTMFLDTSGSTAGVIDRWARDIRAIAGMLRPGDRFRLLTIGLSVYETVPWQDAGRPFALNVKALPGISLINDALAAAFIHDVDPSRRHLIVAFTDGLECGSVVDRSRLIEVGSRADAVVHVVFGHGEGQLPRDGVIGWCTPSDPDGATALKTVAARTGGETHQARFGTPSVRAFEGILRDFRHELRPEGTHRATPPGAAGTRSGSKFAIDRTSRSARGQGISEDRVVIGDRGSGIGKRVRATAQATTATTARRSRRRSVIGGCESRRSRVPCPASRVPSPARDRRSY